MSILTFNDGDLLSAVGTNTEDGILQRLSARIAAIERLHGLKSSSTPVPVTLNDENSIFDVLPGVSYYFIIDDVISTFNLTIGGLSGVTFTNVYDYSDYSKCRLLIETASDAEISSSVSELLVTETCTLSTVTNDLFTFYYFTTGSIIAGFSPISATLDSPVAQHLAPPLPNSGGWDWALISNIENTPGVFTGIASADSPSLIGVE